MVNRGVVNSLMNNLTIKNTDGEKFTGSLDRRIRNIRVTMIGSTPVTIRRSKVDPTTVPED